MNKKVNTPLNTIEAISSGAYDNIILFARGEHTPMNAINYIASVCRNGDKLAMEVVEPEKPRTLYVW